MSHAHVTSASTATEPLIDARGITVSYEGRNILDGVDLQVARGEIVTLIGLNGAGKSTLVRTLLGLITPRSGRVVRAPGLRIGYSPQHIARDAALPLSVGRFLTLGARASRTRLAALLDEVGVGALLDSQLAEISGGELHRVLLARALLREPDLLVLDEPLAGVDVTGQSELYRLIAALRDRYGCGVLLVSHELHVVMAATDRVVCINHHVCCTGHPESVTRHPEFVALFGNHVAKVLAVYTHDHDHAHDVTGAPMPIEHGETGDDGGHRPVDTATRAGSTDG
jgi:zinc transport system ATP-binding protein